MLGRRRRPARERLDGRVGDVADVEFHRSTSVAPLEVASLMRSMSPRTLIIDMSPSPDRPSTVSIWLGGVAGVAPAPPVATLGAPPPLLSLVDWMLRTWAKPMAPTAAA